MADNRRPIKSRDVLFPARIAGNMIDDYIAGNFTDYSVLFRAIVVAIDTVGGKFTGPETTHKEDATNPKNSIRARIVSKDRYKSTDDLTTFWPMFSHDLMPIKEGEYVYVLFENPNEETRGLWLGRAPEPKEVDTANLVLASAKYKDSINAVGLDQAIADMEIQPDAITQSPSFVTEVVPPFTARPGDRVIEGSNNTIIIMGRDRPTDVESGERGAGTGAIQLVAGRTDDEDLNSDTDESMIYICRKSKNIDEDLGTKDVGDETVSVAAIGVKSNEIRIVARDGMKIVVVGNNLDIKTGKNLNLETGADLDVKVLAKTIVDSTKDISVKSGTKIAIESGTDISIKSPVKVTIDSPFIDVGTGTIEPMVLGLKLLDILTTLVTALNIDSKVGTAFNLPVVKLPMTTVACAKIAGQLSQMLSAKNKTG